MNYICLHGRLGRDPEITEKQGKNGPYKQTTFSLAVDRDFGDETDWFYCVITGSRAEVVEKYFHKGSQIIVKGRMESYKSKRDPEHTSWLIRMEDFDFCESKNGGATNKQPTPSTAPADSFEDIDEDVPF